ncbi:LtrC [Enterococcus faecalis]|nr:LtrC [Enterococcus faecalis]
MPSKAEKDTWKEKLVNDAEQKILELTDSDKFKDYLNTLSKFHGYSQRNVDLIFAQDPTATQVAGYKQWQNDFNRHVKKGAKSIRISAPIIKKLTEEDKKRLDTTEDKAIVGYRFIPIFDIKQTSGQHLLNTQDFIKENLQEHKNVTDLYNSFKNYLNEKTNLSVAEDNITRPGVKGYFVPKTNEIVIDNKEQDSALKLKTLYHEYAHSQLHGLTSEFKDRPREYKETQAEAVAYVAMQNIGVDTSDYSLGYVATWAKDKDLIHKAISEIQKVSNKTIDLTAELTKKLQLDQKQEKVVVEEFIPDTNIKEHVNQLKDLLNQKQKEIEHSIKLVEDNPTSFEADMSAKKLPGLNQEVTELTKVLNEYKDHPDNLKENGLKEEAIYNVIVQAKDAVEATKKLYNNDLANAIEESFTLSDIDSKEEADHFRQTVDWVGVADIDNSHNAIRSWGNGYYSNEFIERNNNNPYQENTKIINNKFNLGQESKPQQPNLSDQYKALHDKLKEPGTNKQQTQEQLNKVKTEISQKTQQQLKDFAKVNPDLKQPRVKKEQQTLQR